MAVFIVVIGFYLILRQLRTTLRRYSLGSRFFLRNDCLDIQFTELQVGTETEQRRSTFDERRIGRHGYVTGLNKFHNLIFLAFILKLHVLAVEVESCISIIIYVEIHLITDFRVYAEVYLFIKIKTSILTVAFSQ